MNLKRIVLILLSIACIQKNQTTTLFEQNNANRLIKQGFMQLKKYNQRKQQGYINSKIINFRYIGTWNKMISQIKTLSKSNLSFIKNIKTRK